MALIESGHAARAVGATALNEHSSRSHTIVRVVIDTRDAPPPASSKGAPLESAAASAVAAMDGSTGAIPGGTSVSAGGPLTPGLSFGHTSGHTHITPSGPSLSTGGAMRSHAGVTRSTPSTTAQGSAGQQQQQQGQGHVKRTTLLHLVDLAGSERLAKTGSTGARCHKGGIFGPEQYTPLLHSRRGMHFSKAGLQVCAGHSVLPALPGYLHGA
jgi:hypothetical protein